MVVYKDKKCVDCDITFTPTSGVQIRCGNFKNKIGCSYKARLNDDKLKKRAIRNNCYTSLFTKECLRCKENFECDNKIKRFCEVCYKEARKESARTWYKENKERVNVCIRRMYSKRKEEPNYILKDKVMRKLRNAVTSRRQLDTCVELDYLGCSISEWKQYLESKFTESMSWDNYGSVWDIDHIVPFKIFNMDIEEDRYKVFNYTNTQPLDSYINRFIKKDRLDYK